MVAHCAAPARRHHLGPREQSLDGGRDLDQKDAATVADKDDWVWDPARGADPDGGAEAE